jgi:phosphorylcholine metabolism protein LicD
LDPNFFKFLAFWQEKYFLRKIRISRQKKKTITFQKKLKNTTRLVLYKKSSKIPLKSRTSQEKEEYKNPQKKSIKFPSSSAT